MVINEIDNPQSTASLSSLEGKIKSMWRFLKFWWVWMGQIWTSLFKFFKIKLLTNYTWMSKWNSLSVFRFYPNVQKFSVKYQRLDYFNYIKLKLLPQTIQSITLARLRIPTLHQRQHFYVGSLFASGTDQTIGQLVSL